MLARIINKGANTRRRFYRVIMFGVFVALGLTLMKSQAIGGVIRCSTVQACSDNHTDYLMMVANDLYNSSYVDELATHRASYNGFNVSIVNVENMTGYSFTCEGIHDFIKALYDSKSAEHMGDGHLGFVLLIGDAFKDDNSTVMLPDYDLYGGRMEASDHYYACLTLTGGDYDDYPDVMIGRLSVGNETELSNVVSKIISYETTYATGDWRDDILLFEGQGLASESEYGDINNYLQNKGQVTHFLYYYEPAHAASANYKVRYEDVNINIGDATQKLIAEINDGRFIFNYECDHGSIFGFHPEGQSHCYTYFDVNDISSLNNGTKLPFWLNVCCWTGCFDNTDPDGCFGSNVDCLAERLVNADNKGAIAVLASSRESNTGAYGIVDKYIYEAIFDNYEYLVGEAVAEFKLRPNVNLEYRRQYNLFGDPALNLYPSLEIHYVSGNITQNTTWEQGLYYVLGDVTVSNGVTLTIQPGAVIKFSSNTRLAINGKLTAIGTATDPIIFRSLKVSTTEKGLWHGIVFTSSADNTSSIQYATIKNAEYGVYLSTGRKPAISCNTIAYNTYGIYANNPGSVNITYNTIEWNTYGVYMAFLTGGLVYGNTIAHNSCWGIRLYQGSLSSLSSNTVTSNGYAQGNGLYGGIYMAGGTPNMGNNTIKYNSNSDPDKFRAVYLVGSDPNMTSNVIGRNSHWGLRLVNSDPIMAYYGAAHNAIEKNGIYPIYISHNSLPLLDFGHNDIDKLPPSPNYPDTYHIYIDTATDTNTVYARRNWWGKDDSSYFSFHPPDRVIYDPWDHSSNTGGVGKILASGGGGLFPADYDRLFAAMDLEYQGRYREAAEAYRQIIADYGGGVIARRALSGLVTVVHLSGGDLRALSRYLEEIAQSYSGTGFGCKAGLLALDCLELAGDYEGAIAGYQKLESEQGEAGAMAASRAGEIVLYGMGDKARAERVFRELLSSFPNSEAAELARMHLAELPDLPQSLGRPAPPRPQPKVAEEGKSEAKVVILSQNYPNPANPTTRITFALPERTHVTLEIYNLLGQRVKTLVEGVRETGSHSILWDGRDERGKPLPSGVYLYRLRVGELVRARKMLLLR